MDMNPILYRIWTVCAAMAIISASCTDDSMAPETGNAVMYPRLRIGVSDMTINAASRAMEPMSPDEEKYVKTIAVFEFDNEGLHEMSSSTYHFIDFIKGTVDGVTGIGDVDSTLFGVVESTLRDIPLEKRSNGTICVVANVTENQVTQFYDKYREPGQSYGRMTLERFKTWALPFEYQKREGVAYDETVSGYLKSMYMFGYYEGEIDPAKSAEIPIDLGRLASRLDITIVNETGKDIDKRLGYHLDNVCNSAYFFPMKSSMPANIDHGFARTVICSGVDDPVEGDVDKVVPETFPNAKSHTRYFYVAAHSALNQDDATQLHLFYNRRIVDNDNSDESSVRVPLCNVHPSQAASVTNGYSLSRNTRYHFTIRLKSKARNKALHTRPAAFERPGEITVYLPDD